jgi:hypothetical protein
MDCIRQNHTYKLEHTIFMIAIQEQHLTIAVLHLEVAMRPKPFNYEYNIMPHGKFKTTSNVPFALFCLLFIIS